MFGALWKVCEVARDRAHVVVARHRPEVGATRFPEVGGAVHRRLRAQPGERGIDVGPEEEPRVAELDLVEPGCVQHLHGLPQIPFPGRWCRSCGVRILCGSTADATPGGSMASDDRVVVEFDQHSPEYRETYPAKAHELREQCPGGVEHEARRVLDRHRPRRAERAVEAHRPAVERPRPRSGERNGYQGISIPERGTTRGGFIEMDPPEQSEYRRVLNPFLSPAAVGGLGARSSPTSPARASTTSSRPVASTSSTTSPTSSPPCSPWRCSVCRSPTGRSTASPPTCRCTRHPTAPTGTA